MEHAALHSLLPLASDQAPLTTGTDEPADDSGLRPAVNAAFVKIGAQHSKCPVQAPVREKRGLDTALARMPAHDYIPPHVREGHPEQRAASVCHRRWHERA